MPKKPPIYVLSHNLKWCTFKKLQKRLVHDDGPTPLHLDKELYKLLKEQKMLFWFDPLVEGDMCLGFKLPRRKIIVIKNGKPLKH